MIDTKMLVDDVLLRELSVETRKVGSKVLVNSTETHPEFMADILDVIVFPRANFFRKKYLFYFVQCNFNSVKALKELHRHFPFIPDFDLGIGYVLNIEDSEQQGINTIKTYKELEFFSRPSSEVEKQVW
jgi:hypothetical protein